MCEKAQTPQTAFSFKARGEVVAQADDLERRAEHELARVKNERLIPVRLEQLGQIVLRHRRVDVGVAVVGEHPEVAVEPDVDAAGLHHLFVVRREAESAVGKGGFEVTVREQHAGEASRVPLHAVGVVQR